MVTIYSTPFCPYCVTLKEYLSSKNIAFTDIDVSADETRRDEMVQLSGQIGVPVVSINGEIIIGFDKERIDRALKLAA